MQKTSLTAQKECLNPLGAFTEKVALELILKDEISVGEMDISR